MFNIINNQKHQQKKKKLISDRNPFNSTNYKSTKNHIFFSWYEQRWNLWLEKCLL